MPLIPHKRPRTSQDQASKKKDKEDKEAAASARAVKFAANKAEATLADAERIRIMRANIEKQETQKKNNKTRSLEQVRNVAQ